jgi:hypothetical protein
MTLKSDKSFSQDLALGPMEYKTDYGQKFCLEGITIRSTVPVREIVTVTLLSAKGSQYNTVLDSKSFEGNYTLQVDMNFQSGDEIKIECTNANKTGTVFGVIKTIEVLK